VKITKQFRLHFILYFLAIACALCLLSAPVRAEQPDEQTQKILAKMRPEWRACGKAADCFVIPYSCGGRMAASHRYAAEARAAVYSIGSAAWLQCNVPIDSGMTADCSPAGLCIVADIDWYLCKQDTDCGIARGNCGVEWAVNKAFADHSRKHPPRPDSVCTKPLETHPSDTRAVCKNARCVLTPPGFYAGGAPMPEK
jgi:hypothetical protein